MTAADHKGNELLDIIDVRRCYAENTGWFDFYLFEYLTRKEQNSL